jgi:putative phosphoesterase
MKYEPLGTVELPDEFERVAILSDVHGNLPALQACLEDVRRANVDAIFFLGDLTWGPQPREVLDRTRLIEEQTAFVAGNADRAVVELAAGVSPFDTPIGRWILDAHGEDGVAQVSAFAPTITITTSRLGRIRLCHGSPRSDIELLTPGTPADRIRDAVSGMGLAGFAHGHTHLQYWREVEGLTVIGPGSVGLPYDADTPGARWALLHEGVELRVSAYEIEDSIAAAHSAEFPGAAFYEETLRTPPTLEEIVNDAEKREFSE